MIFCNSIQSAKALEYTFRESNMQAVILHGDVTPKKRDANIAKFRNRDTLYLICTDMASRGLDFPHVSHVIHYDFPRSISDYLHRAGRTGRARKSGQSICLYRKKELPLIKELQTSYDTNKPLKITEASSLKQLKNDMHMRRKLHKHIEKSKKNK